MLLSSNTKVCEEHINIQRIKIEVDKMRKLKVVFKNVDEVKSFVDIVSKYPYEMDLAKGSIVIDAKSLLGIIALGVLNEVDLIVHSEIWDGLHDEISNFVVA